MLKPFINILQVCLKFLDVFFTKISFLKTFFFGNQKLKNKTHVFYKYKKQGKGKKPLLGGKGGKH